MITSYTINKTAFTPITLPGQSGSLWQSGARGNSTLFGGLVIYHSSEGLPDPSKVNEGFRYKPVEQELPLTFSADSVTDIYYAISLNTDIEILVDNGTGIGSGSSIPSKIDVNIQDQITEVVDVYLFNEAGVFEIAVDAIPDSYTVEVVSNVGMIIGHVLCFQEGKSFMQALILAINGTTITMDSPFDFALLLPAVALLEAGILLLMVRLPLWYLEWDQGICNRKKRGTLSE